MRYETAKQRWDRAERQENNERMAELLNGPFGRKAYWTFKTRENRIPTWRELEKEAKAWDDNRWRRACQVAYLQGRTVDRLAYRHLPELEMAPHRNLSEYKTTITGRIQPRDYVAVGRSWHEGLKHLAHDAFMQQSSYANSVFAKVEQKLHQRLVDELNNNQEELMRTYAGDSEPTHPTVTITNPADPLGQPFESFENGAMLVPVRNRTVVGVKVDNKTLMYLNTSSGGGPGRATLDPTSSSRFTRAKRVNITVTL